MLHKAHYLRYEVDDVVIGPIYCLVDDDIATMEDIEYIVSKANKKGVICSLGNKDYGKDLIHVFKQ